MDVAGPAVIFIYMPATPSKRGGFSVETSVNPYYIEIFAVVGCCQRVASVIRTKIMHTFHINVVI